MSGAPGRGADVLAPQTAAYLAQAALLVCVAAGRRRSSFWSGRSSLHAPPSQRKRGKGFSAKRGTEQLRLAHPAAPAVAPASAQPANAACGRPWQRPRQQAQQRSSAWMALPPKSNAGQPRARLETVMAGEPRACMRPPGWQACRRASSASAPARSLAWFITVGARRGVAWRGVRARQVRPR